MSFFSSLFSRKNAPANHSMQRPGQPPLLILLHAYVLDCIGQLAPEKQAAMQDIVRQVYGGGPDWRGTLRNTLHMAPTLDASIQGMWERNQVSAKQHGVILTGDDFADMIVKSNFSHLIN